MLKAILGYQMQLTEDLTAKMLRAEESSIRENSLQVPLMIEWDQSGTPKRGAG